MITRRANTFVYDGGSSTGPGNPTSFKGQSRTFNADNQQAGTGFGYDGNGNPTTYKAATLTFDPENRMTAYGTAQTDAYSGDGLRVWKQTGTTPGTRTYFLYDGEQPVCEYNSSGSFTAANTYGADGLVSTRRGSPGTVCFVCDERGNVSQRTSSTGAVTGSEVYDAYGARTGTAAQADPFGFGAQAGYYTDLETGLILCTHRFYDPQNGRWLTPDPAGYTGGINLYGYCENNPVNEEDAEGLWPSLYAAAKPVPKPKPLPGPPYKIYWPPTIPIHVGPVKATVEGSVGPVKGGIENGGSQEVQIKGPEYWYSLSPVTRRKLKTFNQLRNYCNVHEGNGN